MWELCLRFFGFVFSFCKTKGCYYWKHNFYRLWNPICGLLQIGQKSEKWNWHHNFLTWHQIQFFLRWFVFLVKFSCWSKFHVNISTVSRIFFCKRLTRNLEIGNTLVWVLPNIWRLGWVTNTKCGRNVSNRMLLDAAKIQDYSFYRFWVIKEKPTGGGGKITHPYHHPD